MVPIKSERTLQISSTGWLNQVLKQYENKWCYKPTDEIEKEVDEKCRGLNSWDSDEKKLLCATISGLLSKRRSDNANQHYRSSKCEYLLDKRALACSPDDLGYTNDEYTCKLTIQIINEMGCNR